MSKRVINDPAALGWVYDPELDRWRWEGAGSGSGGGDAPDVSDLEDRVSALEKGIDGGSA